MKFAANLSTMFKDMPFEARYKAAADLGFKAVECQFIPTESPLVYQACKNEAQVSHVLINTFPGEGDMFGYACIPGGQADFSKTVSQVIPYTFHMGIKKIHVLAGVKPLNRKTWTEADMEYFFVENLRSIAEMLSDHMIVGLIEPLCPAVKENYFLSSFTKAIELLERIDSPSIKLLLDIYHLQEIEGSMDNLEKYYKYAGHIQISQSPNRSEPDTVGNIDFHDVFKRLEKLGHDDYIGLEYWPKDSAAEGLKWLDEFGYKL